MAKRTLFWLALVTLTVGVWALVIAEPGKNPATIAAAAPPPFPSETCYTICGWGWNEATKSPCWQACGVPR